MPKEVDLFVMAGQSHMQGEMGDAAMYPTDTQGLDKYIPFYWVVPGGGNSGGVWTRLGPQSGLFSAGHFGPEVTFARELLLAGFRPVIFKYALGKTSIAEHWKIPGEGGIYDTMVAQLAIAVRLLQQNNLNLVVRIRALVWVQGESDAYTREMACAYGDRLKTLITHFRCSVANSDNVCILMSADGKHPYVRVNPEVIQDQKRLAANLPNTSFVSMVGLEKADDSHLTPAGIAIHGKRLYQAFSMLSRSQANSPNTLDP